MSVARRPTSLPSRALWSPLSACLVLVLLLATVGSFTAAFGVMTACTDKYSCTTTDCGPCGAANTWLNGGWGVQGVLLLIGAVLGVLAARRSHLHSVRLGALILAGLSMLLFAASTSLAVGSF